MTDINDLLSIREQLNRIEDKIEGKYTNRYLGINQVSKMTNLSTTTIRRNIAKRTLKCSKKLGKLLFLESDIRKWIDG